MAEGGIGGKGNPGGGGGGARKGGRRDEEEEEGANLGRRYSRPGGKKEGAEADEEGLGDLGEGVEDEEETFGLESSTEIKEKGEGERGEREDGGGVGRNGEGEEDVAGIGGGGAGRPRLGCGGSCSPAVSANWYLARCW